MGVKERNRGDLDKAREKLDELLLEGLRHGFVECHIHAEVVKGGRRRLCVRSGKSWQYTIHEEELAR